MRVCWFHPQGSKAKAPQQKSSSQRFSEAVSETLGLRIKQVVVAAARNEKICSRDDVLVREIDGEAKPFGNSGLISHIVSAHVSHLFTTSAWN